MSRRASCPATSEAWPGAPRQGALHSQHLYTAIAVIVHRMWQYRLHGRGPAARAHRAAAKVVTWPS